MSSGSDERHVILVGLRPVVLDGARRGWVAEPFVLDGHREGVTNSEGTCVGDHEAVVGGRDFGSRRGCDLVEGAFDGA